MAATVSLGNQGVPEGDHIPCLKSHRKELKQESGLLLLFSLLVNINTIKQHKDGLFHIITINSKLALHSVWDFWDILGSHMASDTP